MSKLKFEYMGLDNMGRSFLRATVYPQLNNKYYEILIETMTALFCQREKDLFLKKDVNTLNELIEACETHYLENFCKKDNEPPYDKLNLPSIEFKEMEGGISYPLPHKDVFILKHDVSSLEGILGYISVCIAKAKYENKTGVNILIKDLNITLENEELDEIIKELETSGFTAGYKCGYYGKQLFVCWG